MYTYILFTCTVQLTFCTGEKLCRKMAEGDFQEAVQNFMCITGASQVIAIRTLKEYHGNINDALTGFYNESGSRRTEDSLGDVIDMFGHLPAMMHRPPSPSFPLAADLTHRYPSRTGESLDDIMDVFGNFPAEMHMPPSPSFPLAADLSDTSLHDDFPRKAIHGATGIASELRKENKHTETKRGMVNMNDNGDSLSAPAFMDVPGHVNELEDEMMLAAIEASLQDSALPNQQDLIHELKMPSCRQRLSQREISDIAKAVSLSLQTAEIEQSIRGLEEVQASAPKLMAPDKRPSLNRRRRRRYKSSSDPQKYDNSLHSQHKANDVPLKEWGGISTQEQDDASPESTGYDLSKLLMKNKASDIIPTPLSPSHTAKTLAQLQNDEYLEGLQAVKEKEVNAWEKAALRENGLKKEANPDDKNTVELFVRLPDGSEIGRRFLKSDKLQCLFNFIDIKTAFRCGTYRLIWQWESLLEGDSSLTLRELGLTCQEEPLYLELI